MLIKKTARFISLAALFLIPVFPLIVSSSLFFPFITGKAFFFRLLVEIAFAGWVLLAFMDARYRPKWTPLTIGVTLFALVILLADLLGVFPMRSLWSNFERMEGWVVIAHLWALFMAATGLFGRGEEGRRMWHKLINAELLVALAVAIYGLFQLLGWADIHQGSSRIDASLGNAAYMAVYMLWNVALAVYMFLVSKAGRIGNAGLLKWAYAILAVLFAYELFETATRGTILGLVGGAMLALFLYAVLGKKEQKKPRLVSAGLLAIIALSVIAFWMNRDAAFIQRSEVLSRMASISWSEARGQARNYVWPMAITGFTERPVLGWGQENFNYIFDQNYDARMWSHEQWFDRAHSVYLDWLTAAGALGLLSYLSLYFLFLWSVWKSSLTLAEKSVLTGALAGYAIHNVFVFDNLASYFLFFVALGFADSLRQGKPIRRLGDKPVSADAAEYVVTPAVILALLALMYFVNIRPIQANMRLIAAMQDCANARPDPAMFERARSAGSFLAEQEIHEQMMSCASNALNSQQIPNDTKQGFYSMAVASIEEQREHMPLPNTRMYTLAGSFYNSIGQYDKGQEMLEMAESLSPEKQSLDIELSNSYLNTGQYDKAEAILEEGYLSAPENDRIKPVYAMALVLNGKEAKARELFGDDPAIFESRQMAQVYMVAQQFAKAIPILQKLAVSDPSNLNLRVQLAQAQYAAGMTAAAIETFRAIERDYPQYSEQIQQAIKQVQQ